MLSNRWIYKLSPILRRQREIGAQSPNKVSLIVELMSRRQDAIMALIESNHGKICGELGMLWALVVECPVEALEELARSQRVRKIWSNAPVRATLDVATVVTGSTAIQREGLTGKGVVVAVLDTGIYPHDDLTLPTNRILAWHDIVHKKSEPYDDNGHGTHVAGIIAGNGTRSDGMYSGMAPEARLVGVKVLDRDGGGNISDVIAGIEWCINHRSALPIKVINLSLGAEAQESYRTDPLCRATTAAWEAGIVVCAAAGNDGPARGTINSPGINPRIITVGNFNDQETLSFDDDQLNDSSSRGPTIDNLEKPDLVAPGTQIMSLDTKDGYIALTGTSMATPMVSGGIAQVLQKWPELTPNRLKRLLKLSARDMGLGALLQGAGLLAVDRLCERLERQKEQNKNLLRSLNNPFIRSLFDAASKKHPFFPKQGEIFKALLSLVER
ncbi:MAG TPA: S8 family peptidase [Bacillota bacterium]|nr:S8 family peptidase [Bacillota bacterium]